MRSTQLIGAAGLGGVEIALDPLTNKLTSGFANQYVSDDSMLNVPFRKLNLFWPPVPAKLLEIHMMLAAFTGQTANKIRFQFQVFDYKTGGQISPMLASVDPIPMTQLATLQTWTKVFDSTYSSAPTIMPGQYLQMSFLGSNHPKTSTNNFGCTPFFRCLVSS